jgi:hypothetical protein
VLQSSPEAVLDLQAVRVSLVVVVKPWPRVVVVQVEQVFLEMQARSRAVMVAQVEPALLRAPL